MEKDVKAAADLSKKFEQLLSYKYYREPSLGSQFLKAKYRTWGEARLQKYSADYSAVVPSREETGTRDC